MKSGHLSQYFGGVAAKRLRDVEVNPKVSNQHEFGGVSGLRKMLGDADRTFPASFLYLSDEIDAPEFVTSTATWYDSRRNQPHRAAEYRLYYPPSLAMEQAATGDFLLVAKRQDESLLIVIAAGGSTSENQLRLLFGLHGDGSSFEVRTEADADDVELGFVGKLILELIGVEIEETDENYLEIMLHKFGGKFPTTREFSLFARDTVSGMQSLDGPDDALIGWMEREETLFRTLERHLVGERLKNGFGQSGNDVDEFISYSLSVHNRRKSRVGHALENHLEAIFVDHSIRYSRTKVTENKSRPDFLFPGVDQYREMAFPSSLLSVLGVKSTCKDRWRQVLSEAKRIPQKHLLTLEPGISIDQTNEMNDHQLQLVIPSKLHSSYAPAQLSWLMSLEEFIALIRDRQHKSL